MAGQRGNRWPDHKRCANYAPQRILLRRQRKCGLWRECSVGGDVFSLRESRSAQQKGQPVS